jgi:hypothetical protein
LAMAGWLTPTRRASPAWESPLDFLVSLIRSPMERAAVMVWEEVIGKTPAQ